MANDLPIKPIRDQILIKPDEAETVTKSGFIISQATADKAKGKLRTGVVLATGPGVEGYPMTIKAGDHVVCEQYGPQEFEFKGEKYVLAPLYDVMAVISE